MRIKHTAIGAMNMSKQNVGIDYGSFSGSNRNHETGIHYGVISQNSLNQDVINDVVSDGADYGEPTCGHCGYKAKSSDDSKLFDAYQFDDDETFDKTTVENGNDVPEWFDHKDYTCLECKRCFWSDEAFSDEMIGWSYEADGYKLTDCLQNDVFVLESPFYTYAQFCSPCVPGAGNLDSPIDDMVCTANEHFGECSVDHYEHVGVKTYCLGHDWFEDGKALYRVFKVSDGSEVIA